MTAERYLADPKCVGRMTMGSKSLALLLALLIASPAAASDSRVQPQQPLNLSVDTNAPRPEASITPLDHLTVTVFREPDLSVEDVTVDESGRVILPLVGPVAAAGKSTEVFSSEVAGKLQRYLKSPQVAVSVKQAASRRVTVTGSVMEPGVYPIEGRLTLLQAVALARGPSQVASLDQTLIFRVRNGQRTAAKFNLSAIAKGKAEDPEVISGDTVAIGSSGFKTAWRDIVLSLRSFNIFNVIP
jgi:polysaccharide biosynthesis/export protein